MPARLAGPLPEDNYWVEVNLFRFFSEGNLFQTSFQGLSLSFKLVFVASYLVFGCLLGVQAYLNFDFIPRAKEYTMLRKSSHTPLAFFIYFMLS